MKSYQYDAFISHASEDKESFVRQLADELRSLGLRIWYDEFSLKVGDSLSASIDRGLAESQFGIVVLSKAFFKKVWSKRELQGLVAREVATGKVILPIWLDVDRDAVLAFSPTLADKFAISAKGQSVRQVAIRLLSEIEPSAFRRYSALRLLENIPGKPVMINLASVQPGPTRRDKLPMRLLVRIRLFKEALAEVMPYEIESTIRDFFVDVHPANEVAVWERIAATYLYIVRTGKPKRKSKELKNAIFVALLLLSTGQTFEDVSAASKLDHATLDAVFNTYRNIVPDEFALPLEEGEKAFGEISEDV